MMDRAADVAQTQYTPFHTEPDATPVRLVVRRVKPNPGSQLALFANYSYHVFITDRTATPWLSRPTIAATPRSRTPSATEVRRGAQPPALGPRLRQRCLADGAGHRPQSGPLDWAHRSGRAGGNHQDSPTTLLLPDRAAHPLGTPPHPASSPRLALGKPVRQRSGPIARPAAPLMTTPTASDHPPHYPIAWPTRARLAPQCLLLPPARLLSPSAGACGRQHPFGVATTPCAQLDWSGSRPRRRYPAPLIPCFPGVARSFRWIWA